MCTSVQTGRKQRGAAWLVVLVVLAVGLGGYAAWRAYKKGEARKVAAAELQALNDADAKIGAILLRWGDAYRLAVSSPRITVPAHIAVMQAAVRDLDAVPALACLAPARAEVRRVLALSVEGTVAFVRQDIGARDLVDQVETDAGPAADALRKAKTDCAKPLELRSR